MGIGLNEEIIDKLREENLDNYEKGINTDVPVFYIDGAPFKNFNLKSNVFSSDGRGLRTRKIEDNIDDEERSRMVTMAKVISKVYRNAEAGKRPDSEMNLRGNTELRKQIINRELFKDVGEKKIDGYEFVATDTDLIGLFVNKEKQEVIMGMRGLMVGRDILDTRQFPDMIKSRFTETERAEGFGYQYRKDREIAKKTYNEVKQKYPNYKVIPSGHSRAGRLALFIGRKHDLDEYHAFAPVSNRGDILDSFPRKGGRIYYHPRDPTSSLLHEQQGKTNEQHFEVFHDGFDPHQLGGFIGETTIFKHPRKKQPVDEDIEDIRFPPQDISPEDLVDSDMGTGEFGSTNLDFILLNRLGREVALRPTTELVALSFRKKKEKDLSRKDYNPLTDPKQKNTIGIIRDIPTERKIFNEYIPSVYNDLELKPPKPFKPINFNILDSDKNNKISFDEFKKYFTKLNYDEDIIKDLFNTYDIDGDKNIDREEFDKLIMGL